MRFASPADSGAIARLHFLSHTTTFRAFAPAAWVSTRDLATYEQDWSRRLRVPDTLCGTWIAIEGDEAVGMAAVSPLSGQHATAAGLTAVIRSMHVHPQRLPGNIGYLLWTRVVSFLRDRGYVCARFDIIEANVRARRFFAAAGARLVRVLPAGVEGVPIVEYAFDVRAFSARERAARAGDGG